MDMPRTEEESCSGRRLMWVLLILLEWTYLLVANDIKNQSVLASRLMRLDDVDRSL